MLYKNPYKKLCSLSATLVFVFFLSAYFYAAPGDLDPNFGTGGKVIWNYMHRIAEAVRWSAVLGVSGCWNGVTLATSNASEGSCGMSRGCRCKHAWRAGAPARQNRLAWHQAR